MTDPYNGFAAGMARQTPSPRPRAAGLNRRRIDRTTLSLLARMQTLHGTRTVQLHDVSCWGSMVEGAPPTIRVGSEAILRCHELDVFATVLWVTGERCGIRFDAPIQDAAIRALRAASEQLSQTPEGA